MIPVSTLNNNLCWLSLKLDQKEWYYDKDDDDGDDDVKGGWPPQMLELQKDDRLHLQTDLFGGWAHVITFCVHLISAS